MEHEQKRRHSKGVDQNWKYATLFLAGALVMLLFFQFGGGNIKFKSASNNGIATDAIGINEASKNTMDVIKGSLVPEGTDVVLNDKEEVNGVYRLNISIDGEDVETYISPDGKLLFTGAIELENPPDVGDTSAPAAADPIDDPDVLLDDDAVKGNPDAPVTMVEFSDFQCPYCGRFYQDTYKQIVKEYVDTGKVKIVFRDFPLEFHENAQKAAEAAECAGEQGAYYDMHNMLFENQDSLSVSDLKGYADDLGLNTAQFDDCLDSGKYEEEVQLDLRDGSAFGVSGTPAFFVNGRLLEGALPFESFQQVIEEELAKTG